MAGQDDDQADAEEEANVDQLVTAVAGLAALLVLLEGIRSSRRLDERVARVQECLRHVEDEAREARHDAASISARLTVIERAWPSPPPPLPPTQADRGS